MSSVTVLEHRRLAVASLRYVVPTGEFAVAVRDHCGCALPGSQRVLASVGGDLLAWRSPTETLLLGMGQADFAGLAARTAGMPDGCLVDQTGGVTAIVLGPGAGTPGVAELMSRLGGRAPAVGESRVCRLADLTVAALCMNPGETWLLVERVYAPHLRGWITATLQDDET